MAIACLLSAIPALNPGQRFRGKSNTEIVPHLPDVTSRSTHTRGHLLQECRTLDSQLWITERLFDQSNQMNPFAEVLNALSAAVIKRGFTV
jgi:hypothetical protein